MKKIKVFFMSLVALFVCGLSTSCNESNDSILGYDEYFIVLDNVETNLIDQSTGESLAQKIYDSFLFSNGLKSCSLGKSNSAPLDVFEESCENVRSVAQAEWSGVLPKDGFVTYNLSLRKDSSDGSVQMIKTITIEAL